jgi:hypothetical protein
MRDYKEDNNAEQGLFGFFESDLSAADLRVFGAYRRNER